MLRLGVKELIGHEHVFKGQWLLEITRNTRKGNAEHGKIILYNSRAIMLQNNTE